MRKIPGVRGQSPRVVPQSNQKRNPWQKCVSLFDRPAFHAEPVQPHLVIGGGNWQSSDVKHIAPPIVARRIRRHYTPAQILQLLSEFDRSGLSAFTFARERRLTYSALRRWLVRRRHSRGHWPARARPAGTLSVHQPILREVPLPAVLGGVRWAAEIVRSNGSTLRLAHDVPAALLGELLREGAC